MREGYSRIVLGLAGETWLLIGKEPSEIRPEGIKHAQPETTIYSFSAVSRNTRMNEDKHDFLKSSFTSHPSNHRFSLRRLTKINITWHMRLLS
ncbi:hypothetical protein NPIL_250991 [Nephila pilipes]|uniref:Uncharacterized protein n=1 Tax=Nephila pilipes TaxID=299642 RepID=A0A8X6T0A3_NEPPI|nr:hypothetical protein NPIL_250991 [Nephila pilipes]